MSKVQLISLFFIVLLFFVGHQIFLIFSPFFKAIFWAAILTFAFYPLYFPLKEKLKIHDTLTAGLMTFLIFLMVIPPVILIIINVTNQAIDLYQWAFNYIQQGNLGNLIEHMRSIPAIHRIEAHVFQWEPLKQNAASWILRTSQAVGNFAATEAGTLTKNLFLVVLNVFFMFFLIFIFLKDGKKIYWFIYEMAPLEERNKSALFTRINETLSAVIRGQLLTSLTQAIVAGIIFWALGLPLPLLFAAATFLAALIPIAGASAIWVPLVLYLVSLHQYSKAGILFLFGTLVISIIDNVMKPALIGEKTKLPYFLLFFGILGGIKIYGLMGIFLAPVILSVFFALIQIYQEKYFSKAE